jgi:hypothetical protein
MRDLLIIWWKITLFVSNKMVETSMYTFYYIEIYVIDLKNDYAVIRFGVIISKIYLLKIYCCQFY